MGRGRRRDGVRGQDGVDSDQTDERGMSYEEALMALEFMPYRACDDILKVLYSAAANAKHNYGMNKSKLYISRCWCAEGMMIKRPVARARGRSDVRKKPGNHITMYVKERA